jgi:hypothetical protein
MRNIINKEVSGMRKTGNKEVCGMRKQELGKVKWNEENSK